MSQITITCAECGFALTYNLIGTSKLDITEFVLFEKIYLCKHCYTKGDSK